MEISLKKKFFKTLKIIAILSVGSLIFFALLNLQKTKSDRSEIKGIKSDASSNENFVISEMKTCYQNGSGQCYQNVAADLMKKLSLVQILQTFKNTEQSPEVFSRCHEVTHYLGRIEYEKIKSVPLVFSECDSTCHGGCYHGVMEEYFKEKDGSINNVSDSELTSQIKTICGNQASYQTPRVYSECVHGIGHAAMYITNQDVPVSLKLCDATNSLSDQETCYGGVFMENSSSSTNLDHPTKYLKTSDPLYPCNILEKQYLKVCYEYQSSYFAELSKWDWEKTAQLCLKVPREYQQGCFMIIGSNQVGFTEDMNKMKTDCYQMPSSTTIQDCIAGVISSFGGRYIGNMDKMISFCSLLDEKDKKVCYNSIGNSVSSWSTDSNNQKTHCGKIPEVMYREWCEQPVEMQNLITN